MRDDIFEHFDIVTPDQEHVLNDMTLNFNLTTKPYHVSSGECTNHCNEMKFFKEEKLK